jgi:Zn-dependent protease with chaperone function
VHEDLVRSGRRRIIAVGVGGVLLLTLVVTVIAIPIALLVGLLGVALGSPWGVDGGLLIWTLTTSFALGLIVAGITFVGALLLAERRVIDDVGGWPGFTPKPVPPFTTAEADHRQLRTLLDSLSIAAGIPPPHAAVVVDSAPNCLTIGRRPATAWVVVTTGLLSELPRAELEAVLAYELGRITTLEVSLDTVVYASTARTFEVWAAVFDDFDEVSILLLPLGLLAAPFVVTAGLLRTFVLRSRARLADGLAVRYCRNPAALVAALRRLLADTQTVRTGDPGNAHLWLEYPHTIVSRLFLRTHRILPRRIARLEQMVDDGR